MLDIENSTISTRFDRVQKEIEAWRYKHEREGLNQQAWIVSI
ncbi:hypothetical protein P20495_0164 [Pseudoalteromonas sp. BSi20495]|nr:hypothetical protein P20495_0164 [Pseudoalteromonas sp. BSi20495]